MPSPVDVEGVVATESDLHPLLQPQNKRLRARGTGERQERHTTRAVPAVRAEWCLCVSTNPAMSSLRGRCHSPASARARPRRSESRRDCSRAGVSSPAGCAARHTKPGCAMLMATGTPPQPKMCAACAVRSALKASRVVRMVLMRCYWMIVCRYSTRADISSFSASR